MTTTTKAILLAGDSPLYAELHQLITDSGYQVLSPDESAARLQEIILAVEVNNVNLQAKEECIRELDRLLPAHVPIITTSLAITATEAASWTEHPERVCGFGTLVPLAERELFEIAPALQTEAAAMQVAISFFQSLGKETEIVDDEVGLVFPRILSLIINEAAFTLMEKAATPRDIDIAMKKGTNYPYGPLEWADRIGLDEIYAIIRGLQRDLAEERYRPAPLLRKLVLAKRIGVRAGQGFYSYADKEGSEG
ncbi:3-hydroxyacyl-CoA dehydrogenase family protein [Brevibacillus ruminantium]|uniref:3-hydroxyacyl-CoA dehydrogenase family protein n=1 Tax=Brevibacillus ruminantium TaxID=2950604 RepID=A0ABY4WF14_9BACL|nr:3-hydroxyacyl-CoA dehydrogenase family protein [Brevibacillus ruminantium]USG65647.1 3-hydroxyacyl-CoA dehydrogenase family protein [Brevibacillus ruminantium]